MKPYSLIVLLILFSILSCNKVDPETASQEASDSINAKMLEENKRFVERVDSSIFHIGNLEFEITPSTKADFDAVKTSIHNMDTSEAKRIKPFAAFVSRKGDSLLFKKSDNTYAYITNVNMDPNAEGDDYASYSFIEDMPEIGQWLLMATYYEAYGYVLVNKATGETTELYGMPVVSPDKKYIITFNQDLEAGFTFNGFQLFEMKDTKPVLVGQHELYTWGPDNVSWKDSNTILVQQAFKRTNDESQEMVTEYVQMEMK